MLYLQPNKSRASHAASDNLMINVAQWAKTAEAISRLSSLNLYLSRHVSACLITLPIIRVFCTSAAGFKLVSLGADSLAVTAIG
jgi:hypothetical protein